LWSWREIRCFLALSGLSVGRLRLSSVRRFYAIAKALGCTGYKGRRAPDGQLVFSGLVLGFDGLEQARIAERVLKREDKKPE